MSQAVIAGTAPMRSAAAQTNSTPCPRKKAIVAASVALTETPVAFGQDEIAALRAAGLDDLAISDAIHAAAFFNWANRLMLTLGEPALPSAG